MVLMRISAEFQFRSTTDAPSDDAGKLTGSIARELNELMLIIRGCGAFLRENLDESNPSRAHVRELVHATERATKLAAQLHAFSRSHVRRTVAVARPPRRTKEFRPSTASLYLESD
jgi:hypothetical protein